MEYTLRSGPLEDEFVAHSDSHSPSFSIFLKVRYTVPGFTARSDLRSVLHYLHCPTQGSVYPLFCFALVPCVQPQVFQMREAIFRTLQQRLDPVAIHDFGAMNLCLEHQPLGVYE